MVAKRDPADRQSKAAADTSNSVDSRPPVLSRAEGAVDGELTERPDPGAEGSGFVAPSDEVHRLNEAVAKREEAEAESRHKLAPEVFARLLDADAVDEVLGFPAGTTRRLAQEESFIDLAAEKRVAIESDRLDLGYGALLDPRKREAARLLAIEKLSQTEVAERLGVSRRTIYNWQLRLDFGAYMDSLEEAERERWNAEFRAARVKGRRNVGDLMEIASRKAKELAEQGNVPVIIRVVDKLLKD